MRLPLSRLVTTIGMCGIAMWPHLFASESYTLPAPSGPYAVGRVTMHVVDESRMDQSGSHPNRKREFMLVVWYPAEGKPASPAAAWFPPEWVTLEANGLLGIQLSRSSDPAAKAPASVLRSVTIHAHEQAPLSKTRERFPLIVFGPGNYMFPNEYSAILEEMASQGYIVVGYVPTGFVTAVSFPDGRVTPRYTRPDFALWRDDMIHILDLAKTWDTSSETIFKNRIDLGRIGLTGHSAAATAIGILCHTDPRIKAALLLDAGLLRLQDASAVPVLLLNAENAEYIRLHPDDPNIQAARQQRQTWYETARPGIQVTVAGTDHNSFTDMALIKPFQQPGDGKAFIDTARAFVREFFGEFLMGKHSDLIRRSSSQYPLAEVSYHP